MVLSHVEVLTRTTNVISTDPELVRIILHVILIFCNNIVNKIVLDFVFLREQLKRNKS